MKIFTFRGMLHFHIVNIRLSLTSHVVTALYRDLVEYSLDGSNAEETLSLPSQQCLELNPFCSVLLIE